MPPPSRRWLLFFAVLALLGTAATVIPIVYNLSLQLRPEQLAAARERWRRQAPADYQVKLLEHTTHEGRETEDEYVLEVRDGRVRMLGSNGELLYVDLAAAVLLGPGVAALPPEDLRRYGVEALFDQMEEALRENAAVGRNYLTAQFDPADGHPLRYVRRIRGTKERVEWFVRLERRSPEKGPAAAP
jgi:hypothetical protein